MADVQINRYNVITFPDNPLIPDIIEGIVEGSLGLNEMLFSGPINYGEVNANKFEASIYNLPDVAGEKIQVYQMDDEVQKYLFTGYVDSCKLNEYAYSRDIVAYDILYRASGIEYDIATWWSIYWSDKTESTLGRMLRAMLNYFNIPYIDVSLPFDNLRVIQYEQIQKMSLTDMLSLICTINMCTPNVNREGYVEFIFLTSPNTIDIIDQYAGGDSEFEAYESMLYNKINLYDEDDVLVASYGSGSNIYNVHDNMFLYGRTDDEYAQIVQTMFAYLCQTRFIPASIAMIISDIDINVGDILVTSKGNILVCEQEYSGILLIDQTISSYGETINKATVGYNPEYQRLGLQIKTLEDAMENKATLYLLYDNNTSYDIQERRQEEEPQIIIEIPFRLSGKCYVIFHASVIFNVETIDGEDNIYKTFEDGKVIFQFFINGLPIPDYTPTGTYQDGRYTIHLDYSWYNEITDKSLLQSLKVICTVEDCEVIIPTYRIHGYLTADKLGMAWDNTIYASDDVGIITYDTDLTNAIYDDVIVDNKPPVTFIPTERVGKLHYTNNIGRITDSMSLDDTVMIFDVITNLSLLTYTATISNNTFIKFWRD